MTSDERVFINRCTKTVAMVQEVEGVLRSFTLTYNKTIQTEKYVSVTLTVVDMRLILNSLEFLS